jgi:hypothetical protein
VPKTKLTLSVEKTLIERARRFSERNETTISRLVSEFLARLGDEHRGAAPITARLRGVLPPEAGIGEYRGHLDEKYG